MEVIFDDDAIEFMQTLPKELRSRIYDKIGQASENPSHFFVRLRGRPEYKLRVGDYRVIADINDKIEIRLVGHRKNIYSIQD